MITGIGIDIVEIQRMDTRIRSVGFREKVFSEDEIGYCERQKERTQHYAVRFAAKEAFLKAIGSGLWSGFELHEIEVVNDALGKPLLKLHGKYEQLASQNHWKNIHVSLSHSEGMACAVVIIEQ